MARTKKEFMTYFDHRYFTVEFYHGQCRSFFSGCGMETAIETSAKCSMRGGICFIFPMKYKDSIWRMINARERETKHFIELDFFKSNVPAYILDVDELQ